MELFILLGLLVLLILISANGSKKPRKYKSRTSKRFPAKRIGIAIGKKIIK